MAEWRLFPEGTIPHVSTYDYHRDRERAPHLEQDPHRERLHRAADMVEEAASRFHIKHGIGVVVSDLGCGDGGLLSLIEGRPYIAAAWGYDWTPANTVGWAERGIKAEVLDVFGDDRDQAYIGHVTCMTEVLEHLADPHGMLRWLRPRTSWLVASSPRDEDDRYHDGSHAWAWDMDGYAALLNGAGFEIVRHEDVDRFQVVLAWSSR